MQKIIYAMNLERIKTKITESNNIGLLYGKTGACIIAFLLNDKKIGLDKKMAEELLTDVLDKINMNMPLNISEGLSGIGIGLNYLLKNKYVEGNPDVVLKEIDETLYRKIVYFDKNDNIDCMGLCEILYYVLVRLKTGLKNKMERRIFEEFAKKCINLIYMGKKIEFFEEPLPYNMHYPLPFFLYLCSVMYDMGIYKERVRHILDEIRTVAFTRVPFLNCNKLILMSAVLHVAKSINDGSWYEYLGLLHHSFSSDEMLGNEIGEKQIYLTDGLLGLSLIIDDYNEICPEAELKVHVPNINNLLLQSSEMKAIECSNKNIKIGLDGLLGVFVYLKNKSLI